MAPSIGFMEGNYEKTYIFDFRGHYCHWISGPTRLRAVGSADDAERPAVRGFTDTISVSKGLRCRLCRECDHSILFGKHLQRREICFADDRCEPHEGKCFTSRS